ncbi:MAG: hypothetical protein WC763_07485 [Candidatus Paceibacterota bacterium]
MFYLSLPSAQEAWAGGKITGTNAPNQIIFIDSAVVPNANQVLVEQRLLYAVKAIRSINMLARVPILVAAEAKFGPTGGTVMYMFDILKKHYGENLGEIHVMCESGPHRNPGVPKDAKRTQEMVNLARRQMRFDRVYFSRHLKVGLSNDQTVEGNKAKLLDQMRKFILKKITKEGSTADIKWRWEGEEGHDDMMITFLMSIYWEDQFWLSNYPPYVAWRNKIGVR